MRLAFLLALASLACYHRPAPAPITLGATQDTVSVSYVSGGVQTPGWKSREVRPYGLLIVGDTAMAMVTDRGTVLFVVPLRSVKAAQSSVDNRGPSTLDRVLLGALAGHQRDELLAVETQTDTAADVLLFRVRTENTSQAAAAKIRFRAERLRR